MAEAGVQVDRAPRIGERLYYGWVVLGVATLAMVGTLPGRTQGLGLITEPLLRDLNISRVTFAQIHLVATLLGSLFCIGIGKLIDHTGSRLVLTITALALEDRPVEELVRQVFLRLLTRPPTAEETRSFATVLAGGYEGRRLPPSGSQARAKGGPIRAVSWANHLNPEATRIKQELERHARAGDVPTERLRADWRERMEDMVWALVNSPEFIFVP